MVARVAVCSRPPYGPTEPAQVLCGSYTTHMQAVTATIGKGVFANCTCLVKLTLPAALDTLSDKAFYGRDTMAVTLTRLYGL